MERIVSILLGLASLALQSSAADIIVGPQHDVSDLQTAVSLANDGDRILVEPGNYLGDVAINKSITMLPMQEGTRYTVQGRVYLGGASGKRVVLSGIRVLTSIDFQATLSDRLDLIMVDSYLLSFQNTVNQTLLRIEMYRDTLVQGGPTFRSCAIIGCHIMETHTQGLQTLSIQTSSLPDENHIVGNVFHHVFELATAITVNAPNRPFHIENNLAIGEGQFIALSGGGGLNAPMSICTISNNTVVDQSNDGVGPLITGSTFYYRVIVLNNARIGTGNVAALSSISALFMTASNNLVAAPTAVNTTTGLPVPGSPLIDAGDPDPRYLDLDLTTNDVGCYGGSNSLANFTTPMGSAVVGFMRAPRIVAQGSPVNISAIGFDR